MHVVDTLSLEALRGQLRAAPYGPFRTRLQALIMAQQGHTAPGIALSLGVGRRTVQDWVHWYNTQGLARLSGKVPPGKAPPLSSAQQEEFLARIEAGPLPKDQVCALRGIEAQRILREEFGVTRSLSTALRLLQEARFAKLMPRPRHPDSDPAAQEAFKKKDLPAHLSTIQQAHPDQKIHLFYEDEARFGQQGTLTRVWARKGSRPRALRQIGYEYLYLLAAVCPQTGQNCALIAPYLDTAIVNVFLRQLAASLPPEVHGVLVWDGAGYHKSGKLQVPPNITLIWLPPYSPELNPIENLWHYLRSHYWSNRSYADYDALDAAACAAWQKMIAQPDLLKTVCAAA